MANTPMSKSNSSNKGKSSSADPEQSPPHDHPDTFQWAYSGRVGTRLLAGSGTRHSRPSPPEQDTARRRSWAPARCACSGHGRLSCRALHSRSRRSTETRHRGQLQEEQQTGLWELTAVMPVKHLLQKQHLWTQLSTTLLSHSCLGQFRAVPLQAPPPSPRARLSAAVPGLTAGARGRAGPGGAAAAPGPGAHLGRHGRSRGSSRGCGRTPGRSSRARWSRRAGGRRSGRRGRGRGSTARGRRSPRAGGARPAMGAAAAAAATAPGTSGHRRPWPRGSATRAAGAEEPARPPHGAGGQEAAAAPGPRCQRGPARAEPAELGCTGALLGGTGAVPAVLGPYWAVPAVLRCTGAVLGLCRPYWGCACCTGLYRGCTRCTGLYWGRPGAEPQPGAGRFCSLRCPHLLPPSLWHLTLPAHPTLPFCGLIKPKTLQP